MATPYDGIWAGDKLKRREEARLLERFLDSEARALAAMGRDQAFVLALDAQYGEGKSWFLSRLREQLAINHPVAFVDAWVDDANNEPLVSIMSALDDALQPFLFKKNIKEKLGNLTRAALPIMGRAVLGAGGKLVAKYVGDEFGDEAKEAISGAAKAKPAAKTGDDDSPLEIGVEKLFDGVSEVVDNAGKALLSQYRARQRSRQTFKDNLRQLALAIEVTDKDPRHAPIFVIVDELDRCRPSYAISLLEEIKHLFDVPGIAFVIALHQDQLEHSVRAVYGEGFDARSYLRRFFSRHYQMRRLSIKELVISHFDVIPSKMQFGAPETWVDNKIAKLPSAEIAGRLLSEWGATPREAQSVVDGLRLFATNWDHENIPIELPLVLALLLHIVRGNDLPATGHPAVKSQEIEFVVMGDPGEYNAVPGRVDASELPKIYDLGMNNNLQQLMRNNYDQGIHTYLSTVMRNEFQVRFRNGYPADQKPPMPTWAEYRERVRELGRLIEAEERANGL